jgi:Uncharacterized protein conserved in bacteria (DUF2255)
VQLVPKAQIVVEKVGDGPMLGRVNERLRGELMQKRKLGTSNLELSAIELGASPRHTAYGSAPMRTPLLIGLAMVVLIALVGCTSAVSPAATRSMSAYGPTNPWFRRAKASGAGRIRAGGLERDVTFAEAAPGVHAAIDAAYHAKYDRYGPRIVGSVVGPEVEAVTIKLVPR